VSDTNQHTHPHAVQIGPAVLALYDEVNDLLVNVGKVDDLVLSKTVETAELTEFINGVETEVLSRPIAERYTLKGIFRETLNPNTQRLFIKNCQTPEVTACGIDSITERIQVYRGYQKILKHNNGFYGTGALPAAAAVAGSTFGVGGTIAAGTYVFVVVPMYGGVEGEYEESAGVATVLGDNIALTITPPVEGCTPDSYRIYVYDTALLETRVDADLIHETSELNVWFSSWVRGAAYPGDATGSFTVATTAGVDFTVEVDYTIDETHAMLCVVDDGDIDDGEWVDVTYSFYRNPKINMSIGPSDRVPRNVHPVIYTFKDDDSETPVGRGLEMHLYNVIANSGWDWELSKMEFNTGFNFEWKVLSDPRRLRHGDVYTYHRQFSTYGFMDWAALTEFTNQENCSEPAP